MPKSTGLEKMNEFRMTKRAVRLNESWSAKSNRHHSHRVAGPTATRGGAVSRAQFWPSWWHERLESRVFRVVAPASDPAFRLHLLAGSQPGRCRRPLPADQPGGSGRRSINTILRSFLHWAFGVARYEVSNFLRARGRDRLYFSDELNVLLIEAHEELGLEPADERLDAMARCISKLRRHDQELLEGATDVGANP